MATLLRMMLLHRFLSAILGGTAILIHPLVAILQRKTIPIHPRLTIQQRMTIQFLSRSSILLRDHEDPDPSSGFIAMHAASASQRAFRLQLPSVFLPQLATTACHPWFLRCTWRFLSPTSTLFAPRRAFCRYFQTASRRRTGLMRIVLNFNMVSDGKRTRSLG
jgi:hypothetical protein